MIHSHPFLAVTMAVCVLSLLGVPGTAGFMAKFQILASAISRAMATADGWLLGLVALALLNIPISAVYYLRIPAAMFARDPRADLVPSSVGTFDRAVLLVCAAACIALGLAPQDAFVFVLDVDLLRQAAIAAAALN